jgi:hypothetical protein
MTRTPTPVDLLVLDNGDGYFRLSDEKDLVLSTSTTLRQRIRIEGHAQVDLPTGLMTRAVFDDWLANLRKDGYSVVDFDGPDSEAVPQLSNLPQALREYRSRHPSVRGAEVMLYDVKVTEPLWDHWPDQGPYFGLSAALAPVGQVKRPKTFEELFGGLPPRRAEAWVNNRRLFRVDDLLEILADRLDPDWKFDDEGPKDNTWQAIP